MIITVCPCMYTYIASQDYVNPHPTELVGLSPIIDRLFTPKINGMHLGKMQAKEGKSVGMIMTNNNSTILFVNLSEQYWNGFFGAGKRKQNIFGSNSPAHSIMEPTSISGRPKS